MMFWIEFGVLLLAIYIGIRVGGVGLGLIGGSGAIYIGHHETEQVDVGV